MNKYIRYGVQERKYSSNVIIGFYEQAKPDGKVEEKNEIILMPALLKEEGDLLASQTVQWLNSTTKK